MAVTTVQSANQVDQWRKKFFSEYVRGSRFNRYMGKGENAVIQLFEDLTKKAGDDLTISLVTRLSNNGVTGDSTLRGNEEALLNYGHKITVDQLRNAVIVGNMERQKTMIDLLNAGRTMLKMWAMEQLRDDIITAMASTNVNGTTSYADSTATERNAWLAAQYVSATNSRALFGTLISNASSEVMATALGLVDTTADKLDAPIVSLAKRMAKTADPHIRPIRVGEDEEWYVLFAGSLAFRDLKTDLATEHQNAMPRSKDNPLWRDGDLVWDGVIIREVPEIAVISGVGDTSSDVGPCFLCGAQAVGIAWADRTRAIKEDDDYGNLQGVGVAEIRGVEKLTYNSIQHGMMNVYVSATADA